MFLAFALAAASPLIHVGHVVELCSDVKVLWVDTARIVACVENVFFFGDLADKKLVGGSVGLSIGSVHADSAVSTLVFISSPMPTVVGLSDLG